MHHFFRKAAAWSSSSGLSSGRQSVGKLRPNRVSSAISRALLRAFVPTRAASRSMRASSSARFVFSLSVPCCCLRRSSASSTKALCWGSGAGAGASSSSSVVGRFLCLRRRSSRSARRSFNETNSSPSLSLLSSTGSPLIVQQFWKASQTFSSSARGRFVAIVAAMASCACRVCSAVLSSAS